VKTPASFRSREHWRSPLHARSAPDYEELAVHALIIEDESLIALAIEEALRDCGFTSFDLAVSTEEAVAAASRRCPDLITADVELRPGSGIDAVHSICSKVRIPVLFITGSPLKVRTRMPGHALIEKPFSPHDIGTAIKDALTRPPETQ
jgi:DNA-binding response OmpR family regulator